MRDPVPDLMAERDAAKRCGLRLLAREPYPKRPLWVGNGPCTVRVGRPEAELPLWALRRRSGSPSEWQVWVQEQTLAQDYVRQGTTTE
jgi:hypothetical protein